MPSKVTNQGSDQESTKRPMKAIVKPEERELELKQEEKNALQVDLAERELRAETLRAELGAFERQYLHFVGSRYAELDELKAEIAAHHAAEQPQDGRFQKAAAEARARAQETKLSAGEKSDEAPKSFEASPEMKRLYREVAKRVHPDLAGDGNERTRRQVLMAEANQAYERGDEDKLAKILTSYECSPESVEGEGAGAELIRVIRRISQARGRVAELDAEMDQLLHSDLYQLKSRLDEASKLGRDVLAEMTAKVEEQIQHAKLYLAKSSAPQRASRLGRTPE